MGDNSDELQWRQIRHRLDDNVEGGGSSGRNNYNATTMTPTAIQQQQNQIQGRRRPPARLPQHYIPTNTTPVTTPGAVVTTETLSRIHKDTIPTVIQVLDRKTAASASAAGGVTSNASHHHSDGSTTTGGGYSGNSGGTVSRPGAYAIDGMDRAGNNGRRPNSGEYKSQSSDEGKESSSKSSSSKEEGNGSRSGNNNNRCLKKKRIGIILMLLVIIIIAVVLMIVVQKKDGTGTTVDTSSILYTQLRDELEYLSESSSVDDEEGVDSSLLPSSPQHLAIQWLVNEDNYFGWNTNRTKIIRVVADDTTSPTTSASTAPTSTVVTVSKLQLEQRYILTVLYFATNGPIDWLDISFINPNQHVCDWTLQVDDDKDSIIHCDDDSGRILTGIDLSNVGLVGTIPMELFHGLHPFYTTHLNLANNRLHGTVPTSIGRLTKLTHLDLSSNTLGGTSLLDESIFIKLQSLTILRIGYNNFVSTTNSIREILLDIRTIVEFNVTHNPKLSGIPFFQSYYDVTLLKLRQLEVLDMSGCNFLGSTLHIDNLENSEIRDNVFLPNLRIIRLDHNQFNSTIPTNLFPSTPNLEMFILNSNKFTGTIPTEIGLATRLQQLQLHDNNFSGTLPTKELINLSSLSK